MKKCFLFFLLGTLTIILTNCSNDDLVNQSFSENKALTNTQSPHNGNNAYVSDSSIHKSLIDKPCDKKGSCIPDVTIEDGPGGGINVTWQSSHSYCKIFFMSFTGIPGISTGQINEDGTRFILLDPSKSYNIKCKVTCSTCIYCEKEFTYTKISGTNPPEGKCSVKYPQITITQIQGYQYMLSISKPLDFIEFKYSITGFDKIDNREITISQGEFTFNGQLAYVMKIPFSTSGVSMFSFLRFKIYDKQATEKGCHPQEHYLYINDFPSTDIIGKHLLFQEHNGH